MSEKLDCNVARDLLPLYLDGVCSPQSAALVEEHLAACPECRRLREALAAPAAAPPGPDLEGGRLLGRVFRHLLAAALAAAVMAFCFACNLGGAWMGDPAGAGNLAATAVYVLFWGLFTWRGRDVRPLARAAFVLSLATFLSAAQSLLWRLLESGGFLAGFLSLFASVPLYGLRMFLDWTGLYAAAAALSLVWLLLAWRNLRRLRAEAPPAP